VAEEDSPEFIEAIEGFLASEFNITVDLGQLSFEEQEEWFDSQPQRVQDAFDAFVSIPDPREAETDAPGPGMLALEAAMAVPGFRAGRVGIGIAARAGRAVLRGMYGPKVAGKTATTGLLTRETPGALEAAVTRIPGLRRVIPANRLQRTVAYQPNAKGTYVPAGGVVRDPTYYRGASRVLGPGDRGLGRTARDELLRQQPGKARSRGGFVYGRFSRAKELGAFGAANLLASLAGVHPDVVPDWLGGLGGGEEVPEETPSLNLDSEETPQEAEDLRRFYWEGHTMESGGDKFVNFMLNNGAGVIDWDRYSSLNDYIANTAGIESVNLRTEAGQKQLSELIVNNWDKIPGFRKQLAASAFRRLNDEATERTSDTTGEPATSEEMEIIQGLLGGSRTGGGITIPEGAEYIFADLISEEADRYANEFSRTTPHMMQWGVSGESAVNQIAGFHEQSFDGTPGGSVHTLRDAFSGDPDVTFGPNFVRPYLDDLESRTKQPGQGSPIIAQIQQTLYSMGYMRDVQTGEGVTPAAWGYLDDFTVEGMRALQWDMIENYTVAADMGLTPDMNLLYRELANESIRESQSFSPVTDTGERKDRLRNDVIDEARTGITQALSDRGISVKAGSNAYMDAVNEVMDNLTSAEEEALVGEGGDPGDVTAAERVLKEFYGGSDDWADRIEFGHTTNDSNMFINYAQKVGAISDQEMADLRDYSYSPDRMAGVRARHGKDVAVANFLRDFDNKPMSGKSQEEIHNALIMYANTIGQGYAGRNGFDPATLREMSDKAYAGMSFEPSAGVDQLLDKQEGRIAESMNVSERGIGQANYSRLLDAIDSAGMPQTNRARR
jgi:hypothetical protein